MEVLQYTCIAMLQTMLRILKVGIFGFVAALQSTTSPLEIGSCIYVVDAIEIQCQGIHIVTTIFDLLFAGCEWHVPSWVPHHHMACRLLLAMAMQVLFPFCDRCSVQCRFEM